MTSMKIILSSILLMLLASCSVIPTTEKRNCTKINVGPGPEDIVLDSVSCPYPRLLASCLQRRKGNPAFAEICEVNLNTNAYKIIKRVNEPQGMVFRPHGFDLVKSKTGDLLLYCVSHNEDKNEHSIIVYKVFADRLEFQQKLDSPLLVSPNDVTASCDGQVFVTNDAGKRGSVMEQLFKLRRSNVVHYNPDSKTWNIIANKVCYANGIAINNCPADFVVFSTVRSNKLYLLKPSKLEAGKYTKKTIAKLKGLDNITFLNNEEILVTAHLKQFAYLKHYKDAKNLSPTVVYRVNIFTGEHSPFYTNDGSAICGASTALYYKGNLYLSQVFEPFILKCEVGNLK